MKIKTRYAAALGLASVLTFATSASAASHYPSSPGGASKLCSYDTFQWNGVDGFYHQYKFKYSSPAGGGREAVWDAYHPNSAGGWTKVGITSRIC